MTQDLRCEEMIDELLEYLDRELDAETKQALARQRDRHGDGDRIAVRAVVKHC